MMGTVVMGTVRMSMVGMGRVGMGRAGMRPPAVAALPGQTETARSDGPGRAG